MPVAAEVAPEAESEQGNVGRYSVKQLKRLLELKGIDTSRCLEKGDLLSKVKDWNLQNEDLDKLEEEAKRKAEAAQQRRRFRLRTHCLFRIAHVCCHAGAQQHSSSSNQPPPSFSFRPRRSSDSETQAPSATPADTSIAYAQLFGNAFLLLNALLYALPLFPAFSASSYTRVLITSVVMNAISLFRKHGVSMQFCLPFLCVLTLTRFPCSLQNSPSCIGPC